MITKNILLCTAITLFSYLGIDPMHKLPNPDSVYSFFTHDEIEIIMKRAPRHTHYEPQYTFTRRLIQKRSELISRLQQLEPYYEIRDQEEKSREYLMTKKSLENIEHTLLQMDNPVAKEALQ